MPTWLRPSLFATAGVVPLPHIGSISKPISTRTVVVALSRGRVE